jgi:hypothetical protein
MLPNLQSSSEEEYRSGSEQLLRSVNPVFFRNLVAVTKRVTQLGIGNLLLDWRFHLVVYSSHVFYDCLGCILYQYYLYALCPCPGVTACIKSWLYG